MLSDGVLKARDLAREALAKVGFEIVTAPEISSLRGEIEDLGLNLTAIGLMENHHESFKAAPEAWSPVARRLLDRAHSFSNAEIARLQQRCDDLRAQFWGHGAPGDVYLSDAIEGCAPLWAPDHTGPNRAQALWSVLGQPTVAWTVCDDPETGMPVGVQLSARPGDDIRLVRLMERLTPRDP